MVPPPQFVPDTTESSDGIEGVAVSPFIPLTVSHEAEPLVSIVNGVDVEAVTEAVCAAFGE